MSDKLISKNALSRLEKLRREIDIADRKMMQALAKRFKIVQAIGKLKRANGMEVVQKSRMNKMLKGRHEDSLRFKLDPKLIFNIFDLLHEASIEAQAKIVNGLESSRKPAGKSGTSNRKSKR